MFEAARSIMNWLEECAKVLFILCKIARKGGHMTQSYMFLIVDNV